MSAVVGPVDVLEHESRAAPARRSARRTAARRRRDPRGRARSGRSRPSRWSSRGSTHSRSSWSRDVGLEHGARASPRAVRVLVLGDPRPPAHHLGQRPVRDAVAVGEAAAAVPPDVRREAVDVLLELPGEPRLADPGDADDRDERRALLVGGGVEEILDQAQLAPSRPTNGASSPAARPRRAAARRPAARARAAPARLALELVLAGVGVGDRRLGCAPRRLADEHGARRRRPTGCARRC